MKPTPKFTFLFIAILLIFSLKGNTATPPFTQYLHDDWVESRLRQLSLDEKIAQLMMITVYPKQGDASKAIYLKRIREWKPGGVLVMQGDPHKTAQWINDFQAAAATPLLVAIDGEWGPAMRIDSTIQYPWAQMLGAVQDSNLLYQLGRDIARQLLMLGINMNFAPVADINTNPANPVINFRSFGENKNKVALKAWMLAKGMQDERLLTVAKHFPGHGDTQSDSHKTLPLVPHSKQRIDTLESFPFRYLTQKGITGIMTAHLNIPALDPSGKTSSLSSKVVKDYLQHELGFQGLTVTDAINMKGVRTVPGRAEVEALIAGNDLVEFVPDVAEAVAAVKAALAAGELSPSDIETKCRKVLAAKRWVMLNHYQATDTSHITARLNAPEFKATQYRLIRKSLTVLRNRAVFPVEKLDEQKIAVIMLGASHKTAFQESIDLYLPCDHYFLPSDAPKEQWNRIEQKLKNYSLIIAGIEGIHKYPGQKYGVTPLLQKAVQNIIQSRTPSAFAFFGNAYALKYFPTLEQAEGLILAYQNNRTVQKLTAQFIFGGFDAEGKLPVSINPFFTEGTGLKVKGNRSLSFAIPEEEGMSSKKLETIDSIAEAGIREKAYPGCQVLVARNGRIVYHKCFGYLTYNQKEPVQKNHIYDWASITKVTGALPAIMKLTEEGKISLDQPLSKYCPLLKGSNKEKLTIREILAHQAGLQAWIPFWAMAVHNGIPDQQIFRSEPSEQFSLRVSQHLYMDPNFQASMFDTIVRSELRPQKYLYSGLSFYLYPEMISRLSGVPYAKYLDQQFYKPLGATTVTFNAYKHFPLSRIVPTELDDFFRHEWIRGFVHDEGAAMMGGISGNAGLFGTTLDLAKIFQMYLQGGFYGGKRYLNESTLKEFTRIQFPQNENRRGLGFDKPLIDNDENTIDDAYPAPSASPESFGHSGFTGTFVWADPKYQLLYIFMSNRVHPTRENTKLYELNIRTSIHQAIYDSFF